MSYEKIIRELHSLGSYKTKDVDKIGKSLLKNKEDVSDLLPHILDSWELHRIYFQVNLGLLKNQQDQLKFIEDHFLYLNEWYHTDELIQFVRKYITFDYAYNKAKEYVEHKLPFVRRWGYVLFLTGIHKEPENFDRISKLFHDDKEYYVQMAQAWLIADLCIYAPKQTIEFLTNNKLKYNIIGKAIQKICDSYRIDIKTKELCKSLRNKLKNN